MRGIIRLVEREIAPRLSLDPPPPVPGFLYSKNRFLSSRPRKARRTRSKKWNLQMEMLRIKSEANGKKLFFVCIYREGE